MEVARSPVDDERTCSDQPVREASRLQPPPGGEVHDPRPRVRLDTYDDSLVSRVGRRGVRVFQPVRCQAAVPPGEFRLCDTSGIVYVHAGEPTAPTRGSLRLRDLDAHRLSGRPVTRSSAGRGVRSLRTTGCRRPVRSAPGLVRCGAAAAEVGGGILRAHAATGTRPRREGSVMISRCR